MNAGSNAPLIAGAAATQQRIDDPLLASDALSLMRTALEAAATDAGAPGLLDAADVLLLPQGTWVSADPAIAVAPWSRDLRCIVAEIGVLQQTLLGQACSMIASGAADIVLVAGGEAKFRALRAQILGVAIDPSASGHGSPERLVPAHEILTREEIERGLPVPARQYALIDTALRASEGRTPAEHIGELAALWSGFSAVAAENPAAWNPTFTTPATLSAAPMLAWPYTKLHCSQWNVDQAAGFILCSAAAADRFGVAPARRVFAHVGVESNLMVPVSRRGAIHRSPAMGAVRSAIITHTGTDVADVGHIDLYSCFPAAVRVQARELGVEDREPLTITGGMTFGGGPLNNYTLQSLAAMVPALRGDPDEVGLVTNVSGMLTKFGASVWSCRPPSSPYATVDVSAAAESVTAVVDVDPDHRGAATVVTYTVAFEGASPTLGVAVGDTAAGTRVVAMTSDAELIGEMLADDWCGRSITVDGATLVG
ncbi:MAG: Acetyl-CoA acetyltransferase [Ilumatobacteraceae bacterium]|nr:Acetyl-CoA acetyltransferase [Ilumatobacteraceae bacterium]